MSDIPTPDPTADPSAGTAPTEAPQPAPADSAPAAPAAPEGPAPDAAGSVSAPASGPEPQTDPPSLHRGFVLDLLSRLNMDPNNHVVTTAEQWLSDVLDELKKI